MQYSKLAPGLHLQFRTTDCIIDDMDLHLDAKTRNVTKTISPKSRGEYREKLNTGDVSAGQSIRDKAPIGAW